MWTERKVIFLLRCFHVLLQDSPFHSFFFLFLCLLWCFQINGKLDMFEDKMVTVKTDFLTT